MSRTLSPTGAASDRPDAPDRTRDDPAAASGGGDTPPPARPATPVDRRGFVVGVSAVTALALLGGLVAVWGYRYHTGLDGVSYLAIARRYAEGDLAGAVNGYWGPLLSWLAAVPLALGVPPVPAGHLAMLVGVALVVVGVARSARALGASATGAVGAATVVVPFTWFTLGVGVFADLVMAGALLQAAPHLARARGPDLQAAAAGAWLSVGALAKAVAAPVAVVAVVALAAWRVVARRVRDRRSPAPGSPAVSPTAASRSAASRSAASASGESASATSRAAAAPERPFAAAAATLAVLALTVGAWSLTLATRYGQPTWSTSAGYNVEVVAPESLGNPIRYVGLVPPPHPDGVSAWDEPSLLPVASDGWDDAGASASRVRSLVRDNLAATWAAVRTESWPLALAAAAGVVAAVARARRGRRRRAERHVPAAGAALAALAGAALAAHLVTWVEPRYLWPSALLAVPPFALAIDAARQRGRAAAWALAALTTVVVAAPLVAPSALRWESGEETRAIARRVEAAGVTDGAAVASLDRYQRSAIVCLHAGCRYFGTPAPDEPSARQLRGTVEWVFAWSAPPPGALPAGAEPAGVFGDLRLYRLPTEP